MDDSISIDINLNHETYEDDSIEFYNIITLICQSCELEKETSRIIFNMMIENKPIALLFLTDYTASDSFTCTEPIILVNEYNEPLSSLYWDIFSSHDSLKNFEKELDAIAEKYGFSD